MIRKRIQMMLAFFLFIMATGLLAIGMFVIWRQIMGTKVRTEAVRFAESARELNNPNRGFYYIYDFSLTDEKTDYLYLVSERYKTDLDTSLSLIQISLQEYRDRAISEAGLENLEALFEALKAVDKQLIIRFVYDREGRNLQYEPESLELILQHMEQVGPILREYKDRIFTLQGLFVGNWGEMHGTRYDSMGNLRRLAQKLGEVTDESTYLAVRTPAQRRMITQSLQPKTRSGEDSFGNAENGEEEEPVLESRIGLFNDGMLGNDTDYGTYGSAASEKAGIYSKWSRKEELQFQSDQCRSVPNGGEVITPNRYNDIGNAIEDLKAMHVTYLNREYDGSVLEKWAQSTVHERGCFDGMDGLTYVQRHLGYRLFIDQAEFIYRFWENRLFVNITVKNAGFAPLYREPVTELSVYDAEGEEVARQTISCNLRTLAGGQESDTPLKIRADLDLEGMEAGKYKVYLTITDVSTGRRIRLANEQEEEAYGYYIGEVECR